MSRSLSCSLSACLLALSLMACGGDEDECVEVCNHVRDGRVGYAECGYGDILFDPSNPTQIDNTDIDPRDNQNPQRAYFATKSDYSYGMLCSDG